MRRLLDPTDRFSETLFGLIMVMTFTCTLSVADAGREDVRAMLVAALGCNLAWGIVDGVMYLINTVAERARGSVLIAGLKAASDAGVGQQTIAGALPERVAAILRPDELESMRLRLMALPDPPRGVPIRRGDFLSALAVCILVFLSTFPVTIPFMLVDEVKPALRLSNAIALTMLFLLGCSLARTTGGRPWHVGLIMLLLGAVLVAVTIALGG